jgi:SAM-dependent methyltransferase
MEWVEPFYTQKARWLHALGMPHDVLAHDRARTTMLQRLCGPAPQRILDLGCGDGGTAAALADAGYDVVAVELSPFRAERARALAALKRPGTMTVRAGDFFAVALAGRFDVVCCWDGFGVGTDADLRRLLARIADEWLTLGGSVLLDVFNPLAWSRRAGDVRRFDSIGVTVTYAFDPVSCRFSEHCRPDDAAVAPIMQSVRCYTPADVQLLLEPVGLSIGKLLVNGDTVDWQADIDRGNTRGAWWEVTEYLVQLVRTTSG